MKMYKNMKKLLSAALALAAGASFFSCQNGSGADYDYDETNATVNFTLGSNLLSFDTNVTYSDDLLVGADNTEYSPTLAKFAYALAFDAYDTVKVSLKTSSTNPATSSDNVTLYANFGFEDATYTELSADDYLADKDDLTNAVFAHKSVTSGETTYQIFTLAVQGSSGQAQWQSNFDVGAYDSAYTYATLSATHSAAKAYLADSTVDTSAVQQESLTNYATLAASYSTEHKGFALAASRIKTAFESYMSEKADSSATKTIILLTGHSRGAAIVNILGKVYEDDGSYTTFTYGFATPRTTTASDAANYTTIFNIINSDDLVTELPLSDWSFTRYGTDKTASIASSYLSEWKNTVMFASSYTSAGAQDVSYLSGVATDREDLYKLSDASSTSNNTFSITYSTKEEATELITYLNKLGFGVSSYDPYSEGFTMTTGTDDDENTTYTVSTTFRPQFFLNTMVMAIMLASSDTSAATTFVTTMCSGYSALHKRALYTMSTKITGFAYSHSAPCYAILADNLE